MHLLNSATVPKRSLSVGTLNYDLDFRCLSSPTDSIYLRHKLNLVLLKLMENEEKLVPRSTLIEQIWEGNAFIGHKALNHTVCRLRKIFMDLGERGVTIVTIPKSGYSLVKLNKLTSV